MSSYCFEEAGPGWKGSPKKPTNSTSGIPFDEMINRLEEQGCDPAENGKGHLALCPVHGDRNPSLAISEGDEGQALIICRSQGCEYNDILTELGFIIEYLYVDADGEPVMKVVRKPGKQFRQAQPGGKGDWVWNLKGVDRVLYRLPDVLGAVEDDELVYVCEGEKDAESLVAAGVTATTNPGGAQKWRDSYSEALAGASVILIADADDAGRKHAASVAKSLQEHHCDIRVVEAAEGKDATDHLEAGYGVDDFVPVELPEPEEQEPESESFELTDLGNAERLASVSKDAIRFVPGIGWHAWDGKRWKRDSDGEALRQAKLAARQIRMEAAQCSNEKQREAMWKWAKTSESKEKLKNAVFLAESELSLIVHPEELDADPYLLNVENGTLDLRDARLRDHDPTDLISNLAPVVWGEGAEDDVFDDFLATIFQDRPEETEELVEYLQRFVGYALTGDVSEERYLFLHGGTATGKSTILDTIKAMLGDYAITAEFESFCKKRFPNTMRNDIARTRGKRIVLCSEVEEGKELDVALLNGLVAGDTTTAREMYRDYFEFKPQCKLFFAANARPAVSATADAQWRRMDQIPFTNSHEGSTDEGVKAHLTKDPHARSAFLTWAVEGCLLWQQERLSTPDAVRNYTAEYRAENDPVARWIEEECKLDKREETLASQLLVAFNEWADENYEKRMTAKSKTFAKALERAGLTKAHSKKGAVWQGIGK